MAVLPPPSCCPAALCILACPSLSPCALADCPQIQCVHPYVAQQPDELSLELADVLNILDKTDDGRGGYGEGRGLQRWGLYPRLSRQDRGRGWEEAVPASQPRERAAEGGRYRCLLMLSKPRLPWAVAGLAPPPEA